MSGNPERSNGKATLDLVDITLEHIDATARQDTLRKLFRSHVLQICGPEKVKAFNESNDKFKRHMVAYLAQKTVIELFDSIAQELANELKKI
ncbi:glycogen synthase kinase [Aspergillus niger]|uniref:uncharacterized protein n=1 Tax=Aspergillus lacticoffeatus (strain CBS 101883) TaxID=1450533 RepID=UPI000D7FAF65|nr:uncharacterized protein BO96DRAFT_235458 [Aspergillus niger CBS 101883]PYH50442.1 hypothetical protein BO96DRAFT_235458 [Aspergillus niger CBS 101883]GJP94433.1 glycogen synthase kinase [Aspergillus niger]